MHPKNMVIDGILASEAIDSTGEVLDIAGANCDDVDKGTFMLNWNHHDHGAQSIVGRVTYVKKIYSESDCENERQRMYWKQVRLPYLYGVAHLYDGAGHENAKAIAAIIRNNVANNEKVVCRFSIEGSTLDREGNRLASSVLKRCAITVVPANRTANSGLLLDPNAPEGFEKEHVKKDILDIESTGKSESFDPRYATLSQGLEIECNPVVDDLAKTMTAGGGMGAPSTLTGGAALAREDVRGKVTKMAAVAFSKVHSYKGKEFKKQEFRDQLKAELPEASDEFLDHFTGIASDYHVKRNLVKQEVPQPALQPAPQVQPQAINRLQSLSIDLAQALHQIRGPQPMDVSQVSPEVHSVDVNVGGNTHQAGRFLVSNGQITHLEDYHGLLGKILPQGPMDESAAARVYAMSSNPNLVVGRHSPAPEEEIQPDTQAQEIAQPAPAPKMAPVFSYQRVGMDRPHTLEVRGGSFLLDGNALSPAEVQTILSNIQGGAAHIRYVRSGVADRVLKMEQTLAKADGDDETRNALQEALAAVRSGVAAGHIDPKHERTLTQHIYEDRMTPGIGNKAAAEEFISKKKPGVYINLDGNDFREINNSFGHHAGDEAIKTFGRAIRESADEAVGRKSAKVFRNPEEQNAFRSGGDESLVYVPTHEHAVKFARLLSQKLQALPAIGGVHKASMSMGFGLDPHSADAALYKAKEQKYHPGTKTLKHPLGSTPNLAHSNVPGFEGPVPVHDEAAAATSHVMSYPDISNPPAPKVAKVAKAPKTPKVATSTPTAPKAP